MRALESLFPIGVWLSLAFAQCPAEAAPARSNAPLVWRATADEVDARLEDWSLSRLLREVATATGWEVFVEPDLERNVSARFQRLRTSDALRRLLGDLNFALLPRTNSSSALFIYRTSLQDATRAILPGTANPTELDEVAKPISNELIVTLKKGAGSTIEELAALLGARIVGRADALGAYRLQFDDESDAKSARRSLASNEDVANVDSNYPVGPPGRLEPLAASSLPPLSLKAKKVPDDGRIIVGLVDTAVQTQGSAAKDFLLPGISVAGPGQLLPGELSHGTSMAETILRGLTLAGDAKEGTPVRILPVDIYGGRAETTSFEVAKGIYAAAQEGARIINLSLGSDGASSFVQRIIEEAHKQGIVLVAAAGNSPVLTPTFPAAYPDVIAVTAGDKFGRIAAYANRGEFVDVVAPGASVVHFNQQAYLGMGTSYSSAYISGAAAAIYSTITSAAQLEDELRKRFGLPGKTTGR